MRPLKLTPQEWYHRLLAEEYRSLANANKAIGKTGWDWKVKSAARSVAMAFFQKKVPEKVYLIALGVLEGSKKPDALLEDTQQLVDLLRGVQDLCLYQLPEELEGYRERVVAQAVQVLQERLPGRAYVKEVS